MICYLRISLPATLARKGQGAESRTDGGSPCCKLSGQRPALSLDIRRVYSHVDGRGVGFLEVTTCERSHHEQMKKQMGGMTRANSKNA